MSQSKFAQKQLKKFGWTEGSGLGKNETGMKEAIKVKIKHDSHGVGHNRGDEFSFHWWDHVFNKAASSISVQTTQEGVSVTTDKQLGGVSTKKAWTYDNKSMLYGQFVKGATLDNNEEVATNEGDPTKVKEVVEEDRQMLQKGARHGLKLNGKLERIQEQERLLLEKWKKQKESSSVIDQSERPSLTVQTGTDVCENVSKAKKKKKKRNRETDVQNQSPESTDSHDRQEGQEVKKKKKRKRQIELVEIDTEPKRTKKKKKKLTKCDDSD
ncbi:G patch domain-containing protein 4-like isoform X2 [Crassostrea virginica]